MQLRYFLPPDLPSHVSTTTNPPFKGSGRTHTTMALCMPKRVFEEQSFNVSNKRQRRNGRSFVTSRSKSSSSSEDEEEEIEMKRAMMPRMPRNDRISKAVSQYSDDEEDCASHRRRSSSLKSIALTDLKARTRCFDYLVGSIDEAWAKYCNATSFAEDEVYGYASGGCATVANDAPYTPCSINSDEDDEEYGCKSEATAITDYETELEHGKGFNSRRPSCVRIPSNMKLQHVKDRLTKAKYYLQDFVDSNSVSDSLLFWQRWDLIKYAAIEIVEDEEDECVENTVEELEQGRFPGSFV